MGEIRVKVKLTNAHRRDMADAYALLLEGAKLGEKGLYVTLSESADELRAVAACHFLQLAAGDTERGQ